MKERLKGLWQLLKALGGLLIILLLVMAFFGAFDDEAEDIGKAEIFKGNDTKSAFSGESQIRVTEDGKVVGRKVPEKDSRKRRSKEMTP